MIGSGFGGLAAAIRLQSAGIPTVLFEALDQPGGRARVHRQDGFVFDAGPTVITAPDCLEELFALAGSTMKEHVEMVPVKPFYRLLWSDGYRFDYDNDEASLLDQIRRKNADDVDGYRRFVDYARQVFDKGYTELAAVPFLRFWDMIKVSPALIRLRADRSVYATVARFISDDQLRQAFSFHSLLVGGNPFETSSIYTLIHYLERRWGVFFPIGGTGALVNALTRLFTRLGGELRLSTPVTAIEIERKGNHALHWLSSKHGREPYSAIVSNADVVHTYRDLYRSVPEARRPARRLASMDWSMSLLVLYFGTNRIYPDVAHHTILFGPRYRELLREIFRGPNLPNDFSLYLHAPTRTDPSLAPPGGDAFYVLCPVPHLGTVDVDWTIEGPLLADKILQSLERHLPDLRRHVVTQRLTTPFTFRDELAAHHGSAFSVAPTLRQSAYFRPHNRDERIPGLYLVGAGTHPGAGVPGVVNSAKATAQLVIEDAASWMK